MLFRFDFLQPHKLVGHLTSWFWYPWWFMFLCSPQDSFVTNSLAHPEHKHFFKNILVDTYPFMGPLILLFGLLVMSLLGSSYVHLSCDTCRPLYSQHVAVSHIRVSAEIECWIRMGHLPLVDPREALGTPTSLRIQILSFSCSFR